MVSVVIHTNTHLANQVETAWWLKAGFKQHGIAAEITPDRHKPADVHVVQGPWYCYNEWLGKPNVLWLNRCFYGHPRFDISLGWLNADGSRDFKNHGMAAAKGSLPDLRPAKEGRRCAVVFADYGRDMTEAVQDARITYDSVFFRPHPAQAQESPVMTLQGALDGVWALADVAIGHSSTVLVEAVIEGLHVVSSDPLHVCQGIEGGRQQWLTDLSWANWNKTELERGDFWEHLCVPAD